MFDRYSLLSIETMKTNGKKTYIIAIPYILIFTVLFVSATYAGPQSNLFEDVNSYLINAIMLSRTDPVQMVSDFSWFKVEDSSETVPDKLLKFIETLDSGYPLLNNKKLNDFAQKICTNNMQDISNSEKQVLYHDIALGGNYTAAKAEIATNAILMQDYMDPDVGAKILLANLIQQTYNEYSSSGNETLFMDKDYVEFGIDFCGGIASISPENKANIYMLVVVLARPAGPQPNWIQCGHVFFDKNSNTTFDPGEGLVGVQMTDNEGAILATSGNDGEYCIRRPLGDWTLYLEGFPFVQDYMTYNKIKENNKNGVIYYDFPLLLTQETIDARHIIEN